MFAGRFFWACEVYDRAVSSLFCGVVDMSAAFVIDVQVRKFQCKGHSLLDGLEYVMLRGQKLLRPCRQGDGYGLLVHYLFSSLRFSAAEFMQYLRPVGRGPSLKTWPRWPLQREQCTSMRFVNRLLSIAVSMFSFETGW